MNIDCLILFKKNISHRFKDQDQPQGGLQWTFFSTTQRFSERKFLVSSSFSLLFYIFVRRGLPLYETNFHLLSFACHKKISSLDRIASSADNFVADFFLLLSPSLCVSLALSHLELWKISTCSAIFLLPPYGSSSKYMQNNNFSFPCTRSLSVLPAFARIWQMIRSKSSLLHHNFLPHVDAEFISKKWDPISGQVEMRKAHKTFSGWAMYITVASSA